MVIGIIDKTLFGFLLIAFFQLPSLINEYLQFVHGYYQSTQVQVNGYKQNAQAHEYASLQAMIDDFKQNENAAVRRDAEQKEATVNEYNELVNAMHILQNGHFAEKIVYIFSPERWSALKEVLYHFKPSIPLNLRELGYSFLCALLLSSIISGILRFIFVRDRNASRFIPAE